MTVVVVNGQNVNWPDRCSCCGSRTSVRRTIEQVFKDSDGHAKLETTYKATSELRMPFCVGCRKHLEQANSNYFAGVAFWAITLIFPCIVYGIGGTQYRSEIGSIFGVSSRMAFLPLAGVCIALMAILGFIFYRIWADKVDRGEHRVGDNCTTAQGGVKYVRYICPTPVTPEVTEAQHSFVIVRDDYARDFLAVNDGRAFITTDFDENELWERQRA